MGTIADKLEYLSGTKDAIKTAIEGKGVTVPDGTTFRGYASLIASMPSGGIYQEKTAMPTGEQFDVLPDAGYDAMSKVTVAGDSALKPWNIPEGTTIYGVVGTAKLAVSTDPPADLPVTKGDADTVLTENDATADVSTFDLMVLAQDDGNITYCYLDKGNGKCPYNGVELPELPTLGVDIYPYAIISSNNYRLVTSSTKPESHGGSIADYGGTSIKVYNLKSDGSGWDLNTPYENQNNYKSTIESLSTVVWSSFDILDADSGEIVFAKTNPVPSGAFTITSYDPITTEFKSKGWRRLSYHTTGELAGTWTYDDFTDTESGGWNYLKNIRSCTREKLYYSGYEVWPNDTYGYSISDTTTTEIAQSAYENDNRLIKASFTSATKIGSYAFAECKNLRTINFPLVTSVGSGAFVRTKIQTAVFPSLTSIGSNSFMYAKELKKLDVHKVTSISKMAFPDCFNLVSLIIRSNSVATLSGEFISATATIPLQNGTGYIYVPSSLVDEYKTAANWSVYSNQIRAIEDYPEICG